MEIEGEDKDFQTPPGSPAQAGPPSPPTGTGGPGTSGMTVPTPAKFKPYDMGNIRPELQQADFAKASQLPNLNADEQEFFKRSFYFNHKLKEVQTEEGRPTRTNPTGF